MSKLWSTNNVGLNCSIYGAIIIGDSLIVQPILLESFAQQNRPKVSSNLHASASESAKLRHPGQALSFKPWSEVDIFVVLPAADEIETWNDSTILMSTQYKIVSVSK